MEKNDESKTIIEIVKNHWARAREGKRLLEQGKPLTEMKTKPIGRTEEDIKEKRQGYIDSLETKSKEELEEMLEIVEKRIEAARETELQGTSELYWQRIALRDKLGQ